MSGVSGPGFIKFRLSRAWLLGVLRESLRDPDAFGCTDAGREERVVVEYVSANPTGPLNVVIARAASYGDSLIRIMNAAGYRAEGEFYSNDWGLQAELFGASVRSRFCEAAGLPAPPLPEEGYAGGYVADLARTLDSDLARTWLALPEIEQRRAFGAWAVGRMLERQQKDLGRFGVRMDHWFRESDLHRSGRVGATLQKLQDRSCVEDREGARWFLSTRWSVGSGPAQEVSSRRSASSAARSETSCSSPKPLPARPQ